MRKSPAAHQGRQSAATHCAAAPGGPDGRHRRRLAQARGYAPPALLRLPAHAQCACGDSERLVALCVLLGPVLRLTLGVTDTAFKQQRLKSWQPILTPKWGKAAVFLLLGRAAFWLPLMRAEGSTARNSHRARARSRRRARMAYAVCGG